MSETVVVNSINVVTQTNTVREPVISAAQGPQGIQGIQGIQGLVGPQGIQGNTGPAYATVSVGTVTGGTTAQVTNTGTQAAALLNFVLPKGDTGTTATVSVGTTTTTIPGTLAQVSNVGSSNNAILNFAIPQGAIGATGAIGPQGQQGATGAQGIQGIQGVTGAPGVTGAQGPQGIKGNTGAQGQAGPALGYTAEDSAKRGQANGYAPLDSTAKIAAAYLPSYVDDVVEYANLAALPAVGETSKIYTTLDTNKIYRWSGSTYIEISVSQDLASPGPIGSTTPSTGIFSTLASIQSTNSFSPLYNLNKSNGVQASADLIVANDLYESQATYGDFGINSSGYVAASTGPFNDPNGTYAYSSGGSFVTGTVGSNYYKIVTNNTTRLTIDAAGAVDVAGSLTANSGAFTTVLLPALTASTALALDANKNIISVVNTGTGNNVLATSPVLVTPALGTPSTGNFSTGSFTWPIFNQDTTGNAATATNVDYTGLTGTVPTWNQSTTGNAATATNVDYTGLTGTVPTWNQNTTGNAATATNVDYTGLTGTVPTWNQNTTGNAATATNVAYTGLTGTVPTWNQNTTGNAATVTNGVYLTTAQTLTNKTLAAPTITGTLTANSDIVVNGITVGKGSVGLINNTVVGSGSLSSALMSTSTDQNVAVGSGSLTNLKSTATVIGIFADLGSSLFLAEEIPNVQLNYYSGPTVESGGTYPIVQLSISEDIDGNFYLGAITITNGGSKFVTPNTIFRCNFVSPAGQTINYDLKVLAISTGSGNVAIGYAAGSLANVGTDSIYIGRNANPNNSSLPIRTNEIVIGAGVTGNGSGTVTLGQSTNNVFIAQQAALFTGQVTATSMYVPSVFSAGTTFDIFTNFTLRGTTTGASTISSSQTSGTLTIGGSSSATSAGTITVGQAPGTSTVNIGTGVVITDRTKTVNLGTGGTTGTTNINIGSNTLTTTTVRGPTVNLAALGTASAGSPSFSSPQLTLQSSKFVGGFSYSSGFRQQAQFNSANNTETLLFDSPETTLDRTTVIKYSFKNTQLQVLNTNDGMGVEFMATYGTGYMGLVNTGTGGIIPGTNGYLNLFAMQRSDGAIGSITPATGNFPLFRNKLDDGSGNLIVGGDATTINTSRYLAVKHTTPSTSTTTGALQVAGGVGITGSLNLGGALGFGSTPSYGTSGQVLTSAGSGSAPTWAAAILPAGFGFKNRIINGAMTISQRATSATVSGGGYFVLDRYRWSQNGSYGSTITPTISQDVSTPASFVGNSMKFTNGTGAAPSTGQTATLEQYIEGFNTADLVFGTSNAESITLSFWVKASITGTYCAYFTNSANNRSMVKEYSIVAANTWEKKSISITGDTTGTWVGATNGAGLIVGFTLGSGATYKTTAGTWVAGSYAATASQTNLTATTGATWFITNVQVEIGSVASSFDYRPYTTELILCKRYYQYQNWRWQGSAPGLGGPGMGWTWAFYGNMRAAPTISSYNFTAGSSFSLAGPLDTSGAGMYAVGDGNGAIIIGTTATAEL